MVERRYEGSTIGRGLGSAFLASPSTTKSKKKRKCSHRGCGTLLSVYNDTDLCSVHAIGFITTTTVAKGD